MSRKGIKNLPICEQPREKLEKYGVQALTNSELLAIILRTGNKNENVLELSRKILNKFDIKNLSQASLNQIIKYDGIKKAKGCQVLSCFELARRLSSFRDNKREVNSSEDIYSHLASKMRFLKKESFIGLYLNSRNQIIKEENISIGTLNASLLHPREVFAPAISDGAASIILVHNHPSGDPKPSDADKKMTKKIVEAGKLMNIEIFDHVIIGGDSYFSFADKNLI